MEAAHDSLDTLLSYMNGYFEQTCYKYTLKLKSKFVIYECEAANCDACVIFFLRKKDKNWVMRKCNLNHRCDMSVFSLGQCEYLLCKVFFSGKVYSADKFYNLIDCFSDRKFLSESNVFKDKSGVSSLKKVSLKNGKLFDVSESRNCFNNDLNKLNEKSNSNEVSLVERTNEVGMKKCGEINEAVDVNFDKEFILNEKEEKDHERNENFFFVTENAENIDLNNKVADKIIQDFKIGDNYEIGEHGEVTLKKDEVKANNDQLNSGVRLDQNKNLATIQETFNLDKIFQKDVEDNKFIYENNDFGSTQNWTQEEFNYYMQQTISEFFLNKDTNEVESLAKVIEKAISNNLDSEDKVYQNKIRNIYKFLIILCSVDNLLLPRIGKSLQYDESAPYGYESVYYSYYYLSRLRKKLRLYFLQKEHEHEISSLLKCSNLNDTEKKEKGNISSNLFSSEVDIAKTKKCLNNINDVGNTMIYRRASNDHMKNVKKSLDDEFVEKNGLTEEKNFVACFIEGKKEFPVSIKQILKTDENTLPSSYMSKYRIENTRTIPGSKTKNMATKLPEKNLENRKKSVNECVLPVKKHTNNNSITKKHLNFSINVSTDKNDSIVSSEFTDTGAKNLLSQGSTYTDKIVPVLPKKRGRKPKKKPEEAINNDISVIGAVQPYHTDPQCIFEQSTIDSVTKTYSEDTNMYSNSEVCKSLTSSSRNNKFTNVLSVNNSLYPLLNNENKCVNVIYNDNLSKEKSLLVQPLNDFFSKYINSESKNAVSFFFRF
ncbi:hypothetical protein EDEG_01661 [Edhazardia aedis USNM 41457]|uniref:Uncharacterized protein n=1 Tax=Edhazardia aedis (strain USNM 41457) TaxID=1003232 RepID=J9DRT3_EDHAE|nr:hypothetical protein EDEG_01661 [Edhazardia aedis USNM 41457]|eukprot:EJW04027.1 hypothetical protein EDEG_01661 [Edhazardia aedis USNM 41457]